MAHGAHFGHQVSLRVLMVPQMVSPWVPQKDFSGLTNLWQFGPFLKGSDIHYFSRLTVDIDRLTQWTFFSIEFGRRDTMSFGPTTQKGQSNFDFGKRSWSSWKPTSPSWQHWFPTRGVPFSKTETTCFKRSSFDGSIPDISKSRMSSAVGGPFSPCRWRHFWTALNFLVPLAVFVIHPSFRFLPQPTILQG